LGFTAPGALRSPQKKSPHLFEVLGMPYFIRHCRDARTISSIVSNASLSGRSSGFPDRRRPSHSKASEQWRNVPPVSVKTTDGITAAGPRRIFTVFP
jgi:hypothetical protein